MRTIKAAARKVLPTPAWNYLRRYKLHSVRAAVRWGRRAAERMGYVIAKKRDYYSPLPSEFALEKNLSRWHRPSTLQGVGYDLDAMKRLLRELVDNYYSEFSSLPPYQEVDAAGFGGGFTELDAFLLYAMLRRVKPKRYLEVGSGASTCYCHLACEKNATEGHETLITCIEPYPCPALYTIKGISVLRSEVQDVPLEVFQSLADRDILFIDSSHVLRIDGDVPYLYLEVLPRIGEGVRLHIHDIPFPYNIPYPPEYWTVNRNREWPLYWNEAMVLQAFLAFNPEFAIEMSCPLLRYFDEPFLRSLIPAYKSVREEPNTFSSMWLRRRAQSDSPL